MDGLFRRGGIWYARLVVPKNLRRLVGKIEFLTSTRQTDFHVAKTVASALLADWRRKLLTLTNSAGPNMDIEKLVAGHPVLFSEGFASLEQATALTSLTPDQILRCAEMGQIELYLRLRGCKGHTFPERLVIKDMTADGPEFIVPSVDCMADFAQDVEFVGVVQVRNSPYFAGAILSGTPAESVLFNVPNKPGQCFTPVHAVFITAADIELKNRDLENLRAHFATSVTPALLEIAKKAPEPSPASPVNRKSLQRVTEAVVAYMKVRSLDCNVDQARRVQAALNQFIELDGDSRLCDIDAERLEHYRDFKLPQVPANENKIRLMHGTTCVTESIRAIEGTDWPRLSLAEQVKRTQWLAGMFEWLKSKEWIDKNPAGVLVRESNARATHRKESQESDQELRDAFTHEDLTRIFSAAPWFKTGKGELTRAGTYREFSPHYYWLPLLGLYTGARINELCQLYLDDIRRTPDGTWFYNIATLDDAGKKKRRKNANSRRSVPVHPLLIEAGLIDWKLKLEQAGYKRLFPELKHDKTKGFGKAPTRWFSSYLARLGWPRDGTKVFHSFRSTLLTMCVNRLKLTVHETAQISGHTRGAGALVKHYLDDEIPSYLLAAISKVDFQLPPIARFDCDAGLDAVADALGRKARGHGAVEDV